MHDAYTEYNLCFPRIDDFYGIDQYLRTAQLSDSLSRLVISIPCTFCRNVPFKGCWECYVVWEVNN